MLNKHGFTIVELLVVIVVIGILAAISLVSYAGISQKAITASIQSDLTNASTKLKMYSVEYGSYPTNSGSGNTYCPTAPANDSKYCLKASAGDTFSYTGTTSTFSLSDTNGTTSYVVTQDTPNTLVVYDSNWVAVGTQTWAKANLNVGTRIAGSVVQTNNSTLEKYCYNDLESNCDIYGGLYLWNEAMQYTTTEGAQGICPSGSHIPSKPEWIILMNYLGGQSVSTGKMKEVGTLHWTDPNTGATNESGLGVLPGGYGHLGTFGNLNNYEYLQTSTRDISNILWNVWLNNSSTMLFFSGTDVDTYSYSVRCIKN